MSDDAMVAVDIGREFGPEGLQALRAMMSERGVLHLFNTGQFSADPWTASYLRKQVKERLESPRS